MKLPPIFSIISAGSLLLCLAAADSARAQGSIGWNYQGVGGVGLGVEDAAGAPGFVQDDWNNHTGTGQGPGAVPFDNLFDDSGEVTTADVTSWSVAVNNSWQHSQTANPDEILMNDFCNKEPPITFAEIPYTANGYTVVVYYGNNEGPSTSTLTVGPQSRTITTGNTDQSSYGLNGYIEGTELNTTSPSNYAVFQGLADPSLTVALVGSNNNGISAIQLREELATDPPSLPNGPNPQDFALDVPTDKTLEWNDSTRADEYDVYLWPTGDAEPATPTATVTASEYDPPANLDPGEDYDWKVIARNTGSGATAEGAVWTFSTSPLLAPDPFALLSPADAADAVDPTGMLDWEDAGLASSYHVYLWIPPASQPGTPTAVTTTSEYDPPSDLASSTTYSWTVEAVNATGTTPALDGVWSFTTQSPPAGPPANPAPADLAADVSPLTSLDWDDVPNATSYNVRLWVTADVRPEEPDAVVTDSAYQPPLTLFFSENYTWDVEAVNSLGMTSGGPWTFTVGEGIPGTRKIGWNMVGVGGLSLGFDAVAGAPGFAQSEWNNHASASQAPGSVPFLDLYDDTSTVTTADVVGWSQTANNSWQHSQTDNPDEILTNDFANQEAVITFEEIPYANYDVVVYYGNNEGPTTSTLTVGSISRAITTGNSAQSSHRSVGYVEGTDLNTGDPSNYSVFAGLNGPNLTVAMTGAGNNGISAIQIVDAGAGGPTIDITGFAVSGNTATITFTGEAGITTWQVKASTDLLSFPIDKTPDSAITENPAGTYSAEVDITGAPATYFLRIEN